MLSATVRADCDYSGDSNNMRNISPDQDPNIKGQSEYEREPINTLVIVVAGSASP